MRLLIPHLYHVRGGVERVLVSLLPELAAKIDEVVLLVPEIQAGLFRESFLSSRNIKVIGVSCSELSVSSRFFHIPFFGSILRSYLKDHALEDLLRKKVRKYGITHCLYMITSGQRPPDPGVPVGAVLHDVFWHFNKIRYDTDFVRSRDLNLQQWLRKGAFVVAVSEATKNDVEQVIPGFSDKIHVIHNAHDADEVREDIVPDPVLPFSVDKKNTIFYYPAGLTVQKRHFELLKAFIALIKKNRPIELILTGNGVEKIKGSTGIEDNRLEKVRRLVSENSETLAGRLHASGYLRRSEISYIYSLTDYLISPSIYEGFGLVIPEAISRGIPVICSDLAVFREVTDLYKCGDMVRFFDAASGEKAIEGSMADVLDHPGELSRNLPCEIPWSWSCAADEYIRVMAEYR